MKITCETKDSLELSELTDFQGELKHRTKEDVQKIITSIQKFGFATPFFVWSHDGINHVLDGHGRLLALKKMKSAGEEIPSLPVVYVDCEDEEHAKKLLLRITSQYGEMTSESVLEFMEGLDLDVDEISLPEGVLNIDFPHDEEDTSADDEVPEVQEEAVSQLGEMYELGNSILMCGDSTNEENWSRLMNGKKADLVFTSPPYNGNTELPQGDVFSRKGKKKLYDEGYSDNLNSSDYVNFCKKVLNICFENTDGFVYWNVNYNSNSKYEYIKQIEDKIEFLIEQGAWKKSSAMPLKGVMRRAWEPIYIFSTNKTSLCLKEVESNIWEISNANAQIENHKACFPVGLPERAIHITPKKSNIVIEPFGGSGTTLIASEKNGLSCRIMELDPKYCDVIRRRYTQWAKENGKPLTSGCLE